MRLTVLIFLLACTIHAQNLNIGFKKLYNGFYYNIGEASQQSADGELIAIRAGAFVKVIRLSDGFPIMNFLWEKTDFESGIGFSNSNRYLINLNLEGIEIWDLTNGSFIKTCNIKKNNSEFLITKCVKPDKKDVLYLAGHWDNSTTSMILLEYDFFKNRILLEKELSDEVNFMTSSDDGELIYINYHSRKPILYEVPNDSIVNNAPTLYYPKFSRDKKYITGLNPEEKVAIINVDDFNERHSYSCRSNLKSISISQDGKYICFPASGHNEIRLIELGEFQKDKIITNRYFREGALYIKDSILLAINYTPSLIMEKIGLDNNKSEIVLYGQGDVGDLDFSKENTSLLAAAYRYSPSFSTIDINQSNYQKVVSNPLGEDQISFSSVFFIDTANYAYYRNNSKSVYIYNSLTEEGKVISPDEQPASIAFNRNSKELYVAGEDGNIYTIDMSNLEIINVKDMYDNLAYITYSDVDQHLYLIKKPDLSSISICRLNSSMQVIDEFKLPVSLGSIPNASISYDQYRNIFSVDGYVIDFDERKYYSYNSDKNIEDNYIIKNSDLVVVKNESDKETMTFQIINYKTNQVVRTIDIYDYLPYSKSIKDIFLRITSIAVSDDSKKLAVGLQDGTIVIFDLEIISGVSGGKENVREAIRIYPNPARDEAIIKTGVILTGEAQVQIYNSLGCPVTPASISRAGDEGYKIDCTGLSPGIYIVLLKTPGKTFSSKMIVED